MSAACQSLHRLVDGRRKDSFPFDRGLIPTDGIYVLFESGEHGHGTCRIVRIGTHTGTRELRSRLAQHFIQERKDRSIFRKNIGRALLSKEADPFLDSWNLDLTTKRAKDLHAEGFDFVRQAEIESEVTSAKLLKRFLLEFFELPENGELAVRELAFQATKNRKGEDCMAVPVSVSWRQKGAYGTPSGTPTTLVAWRESGDVRGPQ
jgi:hypothetical protein